MKIIHTSDWHLGDKLHGWDRADEEEHFFKQLAAAVAREQPDALLVCGDIFDTGTPGNDVAKKFIDALLDVAAACPSMVTVVIAGNHDSYSRLVVDEQLWKRCRVHVFGLPAEDGDGKALFAANVVEIPDKGLIAAVPFCHERNFPAVEGGENVARIHAYFAGMAEYMNQRRGATSLPCVLMAHLAVGKETDFTGQDKMLAIGGQECVEASALGAGYNYIALGHIHCPQWIKGEQQIARYSGTPRPINFDEVYAHGIDIVEVESGKAPTLRTEVLPPLRAVATLGGKTGAPFEDCLKLIGESDLAAETYIRLNVALADGAAVGPDWTERARAACVARNFRYCAINPIRAESAAKSAAGKQMLSVSELKGLSSEQVVEILSARRSLSPRQRELLADVMDEVSAPTALRA